MIVSHLRAPSPDGPHTSVWDYFPAPCNRSKEGSSAGSRRWPLMSCRGGKSQCRAPQPAAERDKLRATDPEGLADAWAMVEDIWSWTVAREQHLPEPLGTLSLISATR